MLDAQRSTPEATAPQTARPILVCDAQHASAIEANVEPTNWLQQRVK